MTTLTVQAHAPRLYNMRLSHIRLADKDIKTHLYHLTCQVQIHLSEINNNGSFRVDTFVVTCRSQRLSPFFIIKYIKAYRQRQQKDKFMACFEERNITLIKLQIDINEVFCENPQNIEKLKKKT